MKIIIMLSILLMSGFSFADGNNDWQNINQNVIKLNASNSCQGCVLRNTSFIGADLTNASLSGVDFISANLS
ncbi:MAG: pentapeptide repeat-containing protein, partial [Candidatus Thioglobus sp.]|nr:pentapeptide repeat-containing protein [Candidatus Thioglobus sp.]